MHHETVGADVEDTDHGVVQPEPPPAMLALTAEASPSPDTIDLVRVQVTNAQPEPV